MGSIETDDHIAVDSVAIVGAGPSGLAAAKYLLAERRFSKIVIYEQRSTVGGLWNHTPCDQDTRAALKVPQTSPHAGHAFTSQPVFMSPVYDRLETNIPRGLMGFSELSWPQESQLFPGHEDVLKYIERYAAEVQHLVEFATQVVHLTALADRRWRMCTRKVDTANTPDECTIFDAVIVASGHFDVPTIPPVEGIEAWYTAYPASITHSKFFRRAESYADQKVVVVGNSASGIDIAAQIRQTCRTPLIQSSTSESYLSPGQQLNQVEKPRIVRYEVDDRTIHFADGSREVGVDAVLYCTGYLYSYPFLESLKPSVISTGERVENLYQHIFYQPNPTLAFCGIESEGHTIPSS